MKTEITGLIAGILTSVSSLPQLIKIIREKRSGEISIAMIAVLLLGLLLWIFYGCIKSDIPILATNSFSFLLNTLFLFFSIRYKNR